MFFWKIFPASPYSENMALFSASTFCVPTSAGEAVAVPAIGCMKDGGSAALATPDMDSNPRSAPMTRRGVGVICRVTQNTVDSFMPTSPDLETVVKKALTSP